MKFSRILARREQYSIHEGYEPGAVGKGRQQHLPTTITTTTTEAPRITPQPPVNFVTVSQVCTMYIVLILDGNSGHDAHTRRERGLFEEKSDLRLLSLLTRVLILDGNSEKGAHVWI